jgi:uncharacterized protein (DUF1501 family)
MSTPHRPWLSRRALLQGAAALGLLPSGLSLAAAPGDARLVLVLLRGGLDGLAAVPPHGDPWYRRARGELALPAPGSPEGIVDLDGRFGLHPALAPLHARWQRRELLVVHATALPYRARSHFDAQDLLENGSASPHGARDGWLNRAVQQLGGGAPPVCFGAQVPLVLQGAAPATSVDPARDSAPPAGFLELVEQLYATDPVLGPSLAQGLAAQAQLADHRVDPDDMTMAAGSPKRGRKRAARMAASLETAGGMMAAENGPRIAVIDTGGWDTHATQGTTTGRLRRQLDALAAGLVALEQGLGPAWRSTVVAVVTEFGRTVAPNGTRGTDHGAAGATLLLGGAVAGGRVVGDWPGLEPKSRHEGRDLVPTTDLRAVFKGLVRDHLGVSGAALDGTVFPDSAAVSALDGLVRS